MLLRTKSAGMLAMLFGAMLSAGVAALAQTAQPPATPTSTTPDTSDSSSTTSFKFPEEESRKAADAVKRGENPITVPPVNETPNPPAQPDQTPPANTPPAVDQTATPANPSAKPGKLVLPDVPMIPSHEDGADGPDALKGNDVSSSRAASVVDPDDLDEANPPGAVATDGKMGATSKPNEAPDPGRRQLQLSDAGSSGAAPAHRVEQDENVGDFYVQSGNYMGAYLRFQDAVAFAPDDPYAHYGLATMARKLGKRDEAMEHFQLYLKLEPNGEKVKEAKRALQSLQAETQKQPQTAVK